MADYPLSTTLTLYVVIREADGTQVAPDELVLRVEDPSGTVTEPEVTSVEVGDLAKAAEAIGETLSGTTGVYQAEVTPDAAGTWDVHWQSSAPTRAIDSWFQVPWPRIPVDAS